ncbi:MAG: hypothetical protein E7623_07930 [Ruminococcaceae bacterium]|nr:hypothetical protein [Oscillospiraceae bacterium]
MKNRKFFSDIFSPKLYLEAVKQLWKIGIVALIIFSIEAVLIPLGSAINMFSYIGEIAVQSIELLSMHGMIVLLPILVAPLLALSAFGFLNRRNSADFMHSIPFKRECVFISYFLAVLTWIAIVGFGSTLVSAFSVSFFPAYYKVIVSNYILVSLHMVIVAVYVASAIAFAMSITGTTFNNVLVSGLVLFVPRFLITMLYVLAMDVSFVLAPSTLFGTLVKNYNIIWGVVYEMFGGAFNAYDLGEMLLSPKCMLYLLAVTAVLFVCGLFCFKKRNSESANSPSLNKYLQGTYRIAISMIVCTIACYLIAEKCIRGDFPDLSELFLYLVIYIVAIIAYYLYELITTRKMKSMLKATPGLLLVFCLNFILVFGMITVYGAETGLSPDSDDIKYVQFEYENESRYKNEYSYIMSELSSVKIDDEETIEILCDGLENTVEKYRISRSSYRNYRNNNKTVNVSFYTGIREIKREVVISEADFNKVMAQLTSSEESIKKLDSIYKDIIEMVSKKSDDYSVYFHINGYSDTEEAAKEILITRCEEMLEMEPLERLAAAAENNYYGEFTGELTLYIYSGNRQNISFLINDNLPKTYEKVTDLYYKESKEIRFAFAEAAKNPSNEYFYMEAGLSHSNSSLGEYENYFIFSENREALKEFAEKVLDNVKTIDSGEGKEHIKMHIYSECDKALFNNLTYIITPEYFDELADFYESSGFGDLRSMLDKTEK